MTFKHRYILFYLAATNVLLHCSTSPINQSICSNLAAEARDLLEIQNELLRKSFHANAVAQYNHRINLANNDVAYIDFAPVRPSEMRKMAKRIFNAGCDRVIDRVIQRQLKKFMEIGLFSLTPEDQAKLERAIGSMTTNFATATICEYRNPFNCGLKLKPHVEERMSNSRNPTELAHYWKQWYDKAGTPMREDFSVYVNLSRESARLSSYNSLADYWIKSFDDPNFESNVDLAYNAIMPLYREIHAFVRYRLAQHYGDNVVSPSGNIPMHLLGNIYALKWHDAIDLYTPFPGKTFRNITAEMISQGINVTQMFKMGDAFFKSLHMRPLPDSFWSLSVLERPANVSMVCNAASFDMFQDSDFRISMCAKVDINDFYVIHHELGHIQYSMQYEHQPAILRDAPNQGFHEAVGDAIALSVNSAKHLERIGFLPSGMYDEEHRINWLFKMALQKLPALTYAYTLEKWRFAVFRDEIDENSWNRIFWQMRSNLTGLEPPIRRTDFDFDPPAKYHISADVEYLRYFAAHIFQFQFYKALCIKAGQYHPRNKDLNLDECDIYDSREAGRAFSEFLSLGDSKSWKDALQAFTGDTTMNPAALLEYFKPLYEWLQIENKRLGIPVGWETADSYKD